ncbi:MAG: hypothetical protein NXI10_17715 [bacterium]|nr:hypothetical protein [bacterium]
MIARITIEIKKPQNEAIALLKKTEVIFRQPTVFGGSVEHSAHWSNVGQSDNFKFQLVSIGPFSPWWGKCSLQPSQEEGTSILSILILPPVFILVFVGIIMLTALYTIIGIGINTYGTPGFPISIIIPLALLVGFYLVWQFMTRSNARKIKKEIVASLDEQITKDSIV